LRMKNFGMLFSLGLLNMAQAQQQCDISGYG